MIYILLLILKIIGITMASLLTLILVLILIILFVPIRYKIRAKKEEVTEGKAYIYWLLHIVSTKITIAEKTNIVLKIFGITIYDKLKKDTADMNKIKNSKTKNKKNKKKSNKNKSKNETIKNETIIYKKEQDTQQPNIQKTETADTTGQTADTTGQTADTTGQTADTTGQTADTTGQTADTTGQTTDSAGKTKKSKSKIGEFLQKIGEFMKKIVDVIENFKCKILGIYDTIKDVINNIEYYLNLLERDDVLRAIALSKKHIWKLLYSIRPRKFNVNIHFGMEDPETLGKILSYYSAFYPIYTDHIVMYPEFNQSVFEGNLFAKGKITGFIILRTAWVLYFNQDIRRTISLFKREEI